MIQITARNVNEAYAIAMQRFATGYECTAYPSRNGPMLEMNEPVCTTYHRPMERVLFDPNRDCNPFLHFFECLWMLNGNNDLAFMTKFAKNFADFSDDGETLHGAYGHRWRFHFGMDQIVAAIEELKMAPMSRRVVTQMWDATEDLGRNGKDLPCNTSIFWRLRNGFLDMTVTNRSNDAIWGCYGANAVHFSFLQEYVASCLGVFVGRYYQVSNSLHIYPEFPVTQRVMENLPPLVNEDEYASGDTFFMPLKTGTKANSFKETFDADVAEFMADPDKAEEFYTPFFNQAVLPMYELFLANKYGAKPVELNGLLDMVGAPDWRKAVYEWLQRRGKL